MTGLEQKKRAKKLKVTNESIQVCKDILTFLANKYVEKLSNVK